jgi:hypothetical protein
MKPSLQIGDEIDRLRPLVNDFGDVTDEIIIDGT